MALLVLFFIIRKVQLQKLLNSLNNFLQILELIEIIVPQVIIGFYQLDYGK